MSTRSLFCVALVSASLGALGFSAGAHAADNESAISMMTGPLLPAQSTLIETPVLTPSQNKIDKILEKSGSDSLKTSIQLTDAIKTAAPKKAPMVIVVDKEKHITHVLQNQGGTLVDVFHIPNATGKRTTPTPTGRMMIADKKWDPIWKPPVSIDPQQKKVESFTKNPHNPLGVAWLGLNQGFIGLHGTSSPKSIGHNASHGCVRHKNEDIKKLFGLVPVGTPVYIVNKYAGTKLIADDVDYLNGGKADMVAHANTDTPHI